MSQWSESKLPATEDLSLLMDGELDEAGVARACGTWRQDAEARAQWHAYHLIGDVLRSEDLGSDASRDAAFLAGIRSRLALEPVVLAPGPASGAVHHVAVRSRRAWVAPFAVAAGFVAVAGVVVVTQMTGGVTALPTSEPREALMAAGPASQPIALVSEGVGTQAVADPPSVKLSGQLIRDVRLDEYLAAHKKFGGSSVPGGPSGYLRQATIDSSAR